MGKDLKKLAEKYESLSDAEEMALDVQVHGQVTNEWFSKRPEEINNLLNCSWFHLNDIAMGVGRDDRLRLKEGVINEIPEDETKANLHSASDFIADYFTIVAKFLENPELIETGLPNQVDPGNWGTEEFLLGLLDRRRGGDFGLFN